MTVALEDQLEGKVDSFLEQCVAAFDVARSNKWVNAKSLLITDLRREIEIRGGVVGDGRGRNELVTQLEALVGVVGGDKFERAALELVIINSLSESHLQNELDARHDEWGEQTHDDGEESPYMVAAGSGIDILRSKLKAVAVAGTNGKKIEKKYHPDATSKSVLVKHSILANLVCLPSEIRRSGPARRAWEGVFERTIQPFKHKYRSGASRGEFVPVLMQRVSRAAFLDQYAYTAGNQRRRQHITIHSMGSIDAATTAFSGLAPFRYIRVSSVGAEVYAIPLRVDAEEVSMVGMLCIWWYLSMYCCGNGERYMMCVYNDHVAQLPSLTTRPLYIRRGCTGFSVRDSLPP